MKLALTREGVEVFIFQSQSSHQIRNHADMWGGGGMGFDIPVTGNLSLPVMVNLSLPVMVITSDQSPC